MSNNIKNARDAIMKIYKTHAHYLENDIESYVLNHISDSNWFAIESFHNEEFDENLFFDGEDDVYDTETIKSELIQIARDIFLYKIGLCKQFVFESYRPVGIIYNGTTSYSTSFERNTNLMTVSEIYDRYIVYSEFPSKFVSNILNDTRKIFSDRIQKRLEELLLNPQY